MKPVITFILLLSVLMLTGCSHYGRHHYYRHGLISDQTGQGYVEPASLADPVP